MANPAQRGEFEWVEQGFAPAAQVADEQARAVASVIAADRDCREFTRQHDRLDSVIHRSSNEEEHVGQRLVVIEQQHLFESYLEAGPARNQFMDGGAGP
jgi:hypothetical protein